MYSSVSADFITANEKPFPKQKVRGTIGLTPFTSENVLNLTVTKRNSDGSDIKLGSAFIGQLKATFLKNTNILPRGWIGKELTLEFGLCVSENPDVYEWIPMGVFTIADASVSLEGTVVTAYDNMAKFDKYLPDGFIASGTLYSILVLVCNKCGVQFGMTEAQVEALVNGDEPLGLYPSNDCSTYRDILYWLAQLAGGFCDITRDGKLIIRSFQSNIIPDMTMTSTDVVNDAKFSDWVTSFGSCIFTTEDDTRAVYGSEGVGITYDCGMNPFLIYGTAFKKMQMRHRVLDVLGLIKYQPFTVNVVSAPIFDLGDVIYFQGDIAGSESYVGLVNLWEYKANQGVTIQGFGSNPNLQNTKEQSQKETAAAKSSAAEKEISYSRYENQSQYVIGSNPVKVVDIPFSANKPTDVEIWHEFQLETTPEEGKSVEIMATYYMDLVEVDRKPVETYSDAAKHLLDLHYMTKVHDAGSHEWTVYLTATNGTATIKPLGILAVLKGQGLAKDGAWNGVIVLDDTVAAFSMPMLMQALTEVLTVRAWDLDHDIEVSDIIPSYSMTMQFGSLTESVGVKFVYGDYINYCGEDYRCGTEGVLI